MIVSIKYTLAAVAGLTWATTGYAQQNQAGAGAGAPGVVNPTGIPGEAAGEILRHRTNLPQAQLDRRLQQAPRNVGGSDRIPGHLPNLTDEQRRRLHVGAGALDEFPGGSDRTPQEPADGSNPSDTGSGAEDGSLSGAIGFGGGSGGGGGSMGGSGTLVASQLHGTADVIRSTAEFNRSTAQANLIQEHATGQALKNREQTIDTYFRARDLNKGHRGDERGFKPTQADLVRYSQNALPARLPDYRLNREVGAIRWPAALARPEYSAYRERLNELFQHRSYYNSGVASDNYLDVQQASGHMLAALSDRVATIDPAAYVDAKRFLQSLAHESSFVANPAGVAAN